MHERDIKQRVVALFKAKGLNVNRASKLFGIPQRTLNRQVNEEGNIGMDLVYALLDNFPDVSPHWLLLGDGEMLYSEKCDVLSSAVPFYPNLPVTAGQRDVVEQNSSEENNYISIPNQRADFYFPVSGTSMEPEIYTGDIVGVTRIESFCQIKPDDICLVVTGEERMIKHCTADKDNEDILWCKSPNYPSFSLKKADVAALYKVVARIQYF